MRNSKLHIALLLIAFIIGNLPKSVFGQMNTAVYARYIGGKGKNHPVNVALVSSQSVAIAGDFDNVDSSGNVQTNMFDNANAASKGRILFLNSSTGNYQRIYQLGNTVFDMEFQNNALFVSGDFGIMKINTSNHTLLWHIDAPRNGNILLDIDTDGKVVALVHKEIFLYRGTDGVLLGNYNVGHNYCTDVAIANGRIFISGFDSKINGGYRPCSMGGGKNFDLVDVAFIDAIQYDENLGIVYGGRNMRLEYTTYGFDGNTLACDMGNTYVYKLEIGEDGFLYALGNTDRNNNIFRWNGTTNWQMNGGRNPESVNNSSLSYGTYHQLENFTSGGAIQYLGRIRISDGVVLRAVFTNTYDNLTQTYDFIDANNGAIYASNQGEVFVGSSAGYAIEDRTFKSFLSIPVANYSGGDPSLMTLSGMDFRSDWTVFTGEGGVGSIVAIDLGLNYFSSFRNMAVVGELYAGNAIVNRGDPLAYNPNAEDGENDAFIALYRVSGAITSSRMSDNKNNTINLQELEEQIIIGENQQMLEFTWQLFDAKGTLIKNEQNSKNSYILDKSTLKQGVYFLKINLYNQQQSYKFFVR